MPNRDLDQLLAIYLSDRIASAVRTPPGRDADFLADRIASSLLSRLGSPTNLTGYDRLADMIVNRLSGEALASIAARNISLEGNLPGAARSFRGAPVGAASMVNDRVGAASMVNDRLAGPGSTASFGSVSLSARDIDAIASAIEARLVNLGPSSPVAPATRVSISEEDLLAENPVASVAASPATPTAASPSTPTIGSSSAEGENTKDES